MRVRTRVPTDEQMQHVHARSFAGQPKPIQRLTPSLGPKSSGSPAHPLAPGFCVWPAALPQLADARQDPGVRAAVEPLRARGGAAARAAQQLEVVLAGSSAGAAAGAGQQETMMGLEDLQASTPGGRHDNDHVDFRCDWCGYGPLPRPGAQRVPWSYSHRHTHVTPHFVSACGSGV